MDINLAQKAILEVLNSITPRNARSGQLEYQLVTDDLETLLSQRS
jgi:hypothetical protein